MKYNNISEFLADLEERMDELRAEGVAANTSITSSKAISASDNLSIEEIAEYIADYLDDDPQDDSDKAIRDYLSAMGINVTTSEFEDAFDYYLDNFCDGC